MPHNLNEPPASIIKAADAGISVGQARSCGAPHCVAAAAVLEQQLTRRGGKA